MALRFWLKVSEVREATGEEVEHGHAHGASGIEVVDEDEDGEDSPRTLH
jgi:FKBP-type peptidyl-prolyl cis-trans isomerase SlyD